MQNGRPIGRLGDWEIGKIAKRRLEWRPREIKIRQRKQRENRERENRERTEREREREREACRSLPAGTLETMADIDESLLFIRGVPSAPL